MVVPWVLHEMKTADLHDKRLTDRLKEVLTQLGERPTASIPAACGGHAEMTAAYRLFDNDHATFEAILEPHFDATRKRMREHAVVLAVQDTSEIDMTRPEQKVVGAGPMDSGARRGAFLHPLLVFTPDGTPLGALRALTWTREEGSTKCASLSRAERAAMPIEEKESHRWITTLRCAYEEASRCPATQVVCVADSEADIYELLAEASREPHGADWIVRACQNRALQRETSEDSKASCVREYVSTQPVLLTHTIDVRGRKAKVSCETRGRRQPRQSRQAEMEVRGARVTLRPPWRADRQLPAIPVNVVLVREVNPPDDDEPVEWLLLTSLPVDDRDQVRQVIQYYCARWMIEVYFRVLKSGCRVEERRFEHIDRMLSCLAVYMIVAWRTLYVCRLGRGCPDVSCETVFEPAEWKSVWKVVEQSDPPKAPPRLEHMVRLVAQLGGYVNRARPDPPGPQTIWIGMQRMHDFARCWQLFGPEARGRPELV